MASNAGLTIVAGEFPARSETFVRNHATGVARRGWRVGVVSSGPGEGMTEEELAEIDTLGVTRSYWGVWAPSSARRVVQFAGELLRAPGLIAALNGRDGWTRPELFAGQRMRRVLNAVATGTLHIHYGKYAALLAAAGWTRPAIVTWHGFDANMVPKLRGADVYRPLFAKDWTHTVGSDFMRERLVTLGARPDRIVKIPMGVDFERFTEFDRRGRGQGPLKVISVGRLNEMKGYPVLLEGIAAARAQGADVVVTILGEGPDREPITRRIAELGLTEQVRLLGAQPAARVASELAAADVFALTGVVASSGVVETQGVAYIEAQATGLPVIASDVGGVSKSMIPGETGTLTAERDVEAVADALVAYAASPELRHAHGRAGAEFVRSRFSQTTMLDAFEALYAEHAA